MHVLSKQKALFFLVAALAFANVSLPSSPRAQTIQSTARYFCVCQVAGQHQSLALVPVRNSSGGSRLGR